MKKILLCTLFIIATLLLVGCKASDYKKANDLIDNGNYEEAITILEELGDYKDSAQLLVSANNEYNYLKASDYIASGNYEEAISLLEKLNDYKDSASLLETEKVKKSYYTANSLIETEHYSEALELLKQIEDYKDSKELYNLSFKKLCINYLSENKIEEIIELINENDECKEVIADDVKEYSKNLLASTNLLYGDVNIFKNLNELLTIINVNDYKELIENAIELIPNAREWTGYYEINQNYGEVLENKFDLLTTYYKSSSVSKLAQVGNELLQLCNNIPVDESDNYATKLIGAYKNIGNAAMKIEEGCIKKDTDTVQSGIDAFKIEFIALFALDAKYLLILDDISEFYDNVEKTING